MMKKRSPQLQDDYINKKIQSQMEKYKDQSPISRTAIFKVLLYAIIMAIVPVSSYYWVKSALVSYMEFSEDSANIPSAVVAIIVVHIVLASFVYSAYTEKIPEKKKVE